MVNPAGTAHVPECSCQDNWSIYKSSVTCGKPQCSGAATQASFKKVNMYVMFDRSGVDARHQVERVDASAQDVLPELDLVGPRHRARILPTRLRAARAATVAPTLTSTTYTATGCNATLCANPMVALGTLSSAAAPTDTQEQALVSAINGLSPDGWTPSWSALKGSYDWATAHQAANPNEIDVVVFITDGEPTECLFGGSSTSTNTELANMAETAYLGSGIRTYTISMQGANTTALDAIAVKGGTGQAFVIGNANQQQVATDLTTALQSIAGQNASCDFPLPNQGLFDPGQATITYTPGSGAATTLQKQTASANCGTAGTSTTTRRRARSRFARARVRPSRPTTPRRSKSTSVVPRSRKRRRSPRSTSRIARPRLVRSGSTWPTSSRGRATQRSSSAPGWHGPSWSSRWRRTATSRLRPRAQMFAR